MISLEQDVKEAFTQGTDNQVTNEVGGENHSQSANSEVSAREEKLPLLENVLLGDLFNFFYLFLNLNRER
jgi:hypothetical protein